MLRAHKMASVVKDSVLTVDVRKTRPQGHLGHFVTATMIVKIHQEHAV